MESVEKSDRINCLLEGIHDNSVFVNHAFDLEHVSKLLKDRNQVILSDAEQLLVVSQELELDVISILSQGHLFLC